MKKILFFLSIIYLIASVAIGTDVLGESDYQADPGVITSLHGVLAKAIKERSAVSSLDKSAMVTANEKIANTKIQILDSLDSLDSQIGVAVGGLKDLTLRRSKIKGKTRKLERDYSDFGKKWDDSNYKEAVESIFPKLNDCRIVDAQKGGGLLAAVGDFFGFSDSASDSALECTGLTRKKYKKITGKSQSNIPSKGPYMLRSGDIINYVDKENKALESDPEGIDADLKQQTEDIGEAFGLQGNSPESIIRKLQGFKKGQSTLLLSNTQVKLKLTKPEFKSILEAIKNKGRHISLLFRSAQSLKKLFDEDDREFNEFKRRVKADLDATLIGEYVTEKIATLKDRLSLKLQTCCSSNNPSISDNVGGSSGGSNLSGDNNNSVTNKGK